MQKKEDCWKLLGILGPSIWAKGLGIEGERDEDIEGYTDR